MSDLVSYLRMQLMTSEELKGCPAPIVEKTIELTLRELTHMFPDEAPMGCLAGDLVCCEHCEDWFEYDQTHDLSDDGPRVCDDCFKEAVEAAKREREGSGDSPS
jgi:hypothetical protein